MANDGMIEFLSPNALAQLKEASAIVDKLVPQIEKISNYKAPKTPSGADSTAKEMEKALMAQEKAMEKARVGLQKLADAQKQAESKRIASINAEWAAYEKAKNQEKQASDKLLATEIANAEKAAKAEIDKNNKITQAAEKRAEREKQIEDKKEASILAAQQRQLERQAKIDARDSRTGASSVIPGMGSKIADVKNAEKEAIALEKAALSNQKLNDAYGKLNASRNQAARTLQNLIASETASNAEIRKAQREFDTLNAKVKKADQAVGNFSRNVGNYGSALSGVTQLMSAFGVATGLALGADLVKNVFQTTKELQSLDLALKMVSETQDKYAANTSFVRELSEKWGIEIKGLTEQFTQFYVNAKGKLSEDAIRKSFEGIAKAGALMGISIDKQNDAFYAFNQMLSKGTVQAEELKKQLGNALPGAIKAATMAYQELNPNLKVTEQMMLDQMKAGKLVSTEMVPAIIRAYQKLYGIENVNGVDTLSAATNRLSNSWTELIRSLNESETGGISKFFNIVITGLDGILQGIILINESSLQARERILKMLENNAYQQYYEGLKDLQKEDLENTKNYNSEKILENVSLINQLTEQNKNYAKDATLGGAKRYELTQSNIKQIQELNNLTSRLKGENRAINDILKDRLKALNPPQGAGDGDDAKKKQKERIDLNYEEVESLYKLQIAKLKEQQVLQKEITDNQDAPDYTRLEARKEFSRLAVEILDTQYKKEQALALQNLTDNLNKAKEQYEKNKENGYNDVKNNEEFAKAKADIEATFLNETELALINHSRNWQNLMYEDADFNEKIKKATFDKEEKLRKQTIKDINDLNDAIVKSEQEKQLKISNNERLTLKTRQSAFQEYQHQALLQLQRDKQRETTGKETITQLALLDKKYEELAEAITGLESPLDVANQKMKDFLRNSAIDTINTGLDSLGLNSLKIFTDIDEKGQSTFEKLFEAAKLTGEELQVVFQGVGDVFQDVMNMMAQASQARFDREREQLAQETEIALAFAGDLDTARAEIERQAEQRRKEIARREFKAKKEQAIFNIIIDTAQAVVAALPNFVLAAFVAVLGAAQLAFVSSQQPPAYKTGTDNHIGGAMLVNDGAGSNYKETIQTPDGKIYQPKERNVIMNAPKGTKVFTHDQWQRNLDNILMKNEINYAQPNVVVNSGMSDEQVEKIVSSINNKESVQIYNDGVNIVTKRKKANQLIEIANRRINFISKSV
jgi:tape measure domain-containing protein